MSPVPRNGQDIPLHARKAEDGAHFVGNLGVSAHAFDDGALGIVLGAGEGPKQAMHFSPGQAEQLRGFLRIIDANSRPRSLLDEAREIVAGARKQTHGAPERNSEAIALVWTALLVDLLKPDAKIPPPLVNLMMAGMKLVRASKDTRHRDHQLDVIGYVHLNEVCRYIDPA